MRRKININKQWRFVKGDLEVLNDAEPDSVIVDLPHTWNAEDGQDGGDDYYRGTCCYVKDLEKPEIQMGEQVYLEFQGVNSSAKVYVNGKELISHDGGYSTFRVNITDVLEEYNRVVVQVDNGKNDRVYPQKADFTFYGGIYRDVTMLVVPGPHFALGYLGGNGIKVTPKVVGNTARITLEAWTEQAAGANVRFTVSGNRENLICVAVTDDSGYAKAELVIQDVHLWNGRKDPYLYRAKAELMMEQDSEESIADEVSVKFGCRTISVDAEKGFFLNGSSYPLRGVSRHQDREGVGNALTKEMHEEDIKLILELGANSIRLAHYQHDQYFYDLCDKNGIIVWAEIPYITKHMTNGRENTLSQMRELIIQNYNHPSIAVWGLSNEITAGGVNDMVRENNKALHELVHELDPTRPTVMACAFMLDINDSILNVPDLISYNHYFGWYMGTAEDNDAWFDHFHAKYPNKAIGLSEYGAEAVLKWQTSKPVRGDYTEQYQAEYHEHMLEMIEERPYLWCTYVWNMFDFAADAREEGGARGRNNKGLVTFDRSTKKDAYYIYKAYWSEEPFVYITGRRYRERAEEQIEVKVYSNQPEVSLYLNEQLIETKAGSRIFRFLVSLTEENRLKAAAGTCIDEILIIKVEKENEAYHLPMPKEVSNWLNDAEIRVKEGYFSICDKIGKIMETPEGASIIQDMLDKKEQITEARRKKTDAGNVADSVVISRETMIMMMRSMSIEELVKRGGLAAESARELNRRLTMIKKPN